MKQTFGRLLVEAALIVFSVLFAFWIDDRSQAAEDASLKAELLSRMYKEIQTDSVNLTWHVARRNDVRRSVRTLIDYVNAGNIREDSLAGLLQKIEWFWKYETNNHTYSSIINSGLLRLFERSGVFMNISRYYNDNANIIPFTDAYMIVSRTNLSPYLNLHFDRRLYTDTPGSRKRGIDLARFTSREFINILYSLMDVLIVENFFERHLQNQAIVLGDIRGSL